MSALSSGSPLAPPASTADPRNGHSRTRRSSGFVEYVVNKSRDTEQLRKWFTKPAPEEINEPLSTADPTYAEVPEELKRRTLLRRAESFYHKKAGQRRPSGFVVPFLAVVFLIPATLVWLLSCGRRSIFPQSNREATPPPATSVSVPPSQQSEKPSLSGFAGSSTQPIGSTPAGRHGYEFGSPWSFARSWALYIVYIPVTRYHGTGGLKGALLPSQSPKFLNDHAAALKKGRDLEENAKNEFERVKRLHRRAVVQRRDELEAAEKLLDDPTKAEEYEQAVKKYETRQKTAMRLKMALDDAQHELEWVREVAKTETCAAATSYRGIADWASDAHGSYSNLMNAISGVCFVGAGLTYSSIFSASRGSIGLMSWAFSLFIVGLAILITVQSLLMWCSRLENYPFSTPKLWEFFLGVGVYGACAAVVTAITLLVITVFSLNFNVGAGGDVYQNDNASPWDAHLIFNVNPRYAAIVAFGFIGAGVIVAILVFGLFSMANSIKLLLWRRSIERSKKIRVRLDDLV